MPPKVVVFPLLMHSSTKSRRLKSPLRYIQKFTSNYLCSQILPSLGSKTGSPQRNLSSISVFSARAGVSVRDRNDLLGYF